MRKTASLINEKFIKEAVFLYDNKLVLNSCMQTGKTISVTINGK